MYDIWTGEGAKPPSTPRENAIPRATRNRTLIAQARISEAELAEWRVKAAAAGVPLSELLRRAMARTRTWKGCWKDCARPSPAGPRPAKGG